METDKLFGIFSEEEPVTNTTDYWYGIRANTLVEEDTSFWDGWYVDFQPETEDWFLGKALPAILA